MSFKTAFKFLSCLFAVVVLSCGFYSSKNSTEYQFANPVPKKQSSSISTKISQKSGKAFGRSHEAGIETNSQNEQVVFIIWFKPFGKSNPDRVFKDCGGCLFTQNRSKLQGNGIKVVVIHYGEFNYADLPKTRLKNHLYAWWTMESPLTIKNNKKIEHSKHVDGIFNFSITHRRDSDVYFPYQNAVQVYQHVNPRKKPKTEAELDQLIREKTNIALWVVSNCNVNKGAIDRMKYVRRMMRAGLNLTFGGRCSGSRVRQEFNHTKYKFYLAFENSWGCKDYITEKFWKNSLSAGTVPVVIGAPKSDYEAVAPPNSFIYAHDYSSPEELVKYLKYLDANDEAYKKYLRWMTLKMSKMPGFNQKTNFCSLCLKVKSLKVGDDNNLLPISTTLSRHNFSLKSWFIENDNRACVYPSK